MSNFSEERATMIAAGDLQEFVPFCREHCKHHPNTLNLQLRQLQPASELWSSDGAAGLVGSLQEVTLHNKQKESWQLRRGGSEIGEVDYDKELYVAGNMVIWSKGSKTQALALYKAFTVNSPVQQIITARITQCFSELLKKYARLIKIVAVVVSVNCGPSGRTRAVYLVSGPSCSSGTIASS